MNTILLIIAIIVTAVLFFLNAIACIILFREDSDVVASGLALINSLVLLFLLSLLICIKC